LTNIIYNVSPLLTYYERRNAYFLIHYLDREAYAAIID